jgi:hypothetical protein
VRVQCLLRSNLVYRRDAFDAGFAKLGYKPYYNGVIDHNDVLVIWNRYGHGHELAQAYERAEGKVIVCENGHLGKGWRSETWMAMALSHHAGAGHWPYGGPQRWDSWNEPLAPWRTNGTEYLVFAQRGIGEPGLRSPPNWAEGIVEKLRKRRPELSVRIRAHPGAGQAKISLEEDLRNAKGAITWHSAAALAALKSGVPIWYDCPSWIGRNAGKPFDALLQSEDPATDDAKRLETFRNVAWAMWTIDEIATGAPFKHLLGTADQRAAA